MKIEQFHNKNQFLITDDDNMVGYEELCKLNEKIYVEFRDKKNV